MSVTNAHIQDSDMTSNEKNTITHHKNTKTELEQKHRGGNTVKQQQVIWNRTENGQQMIFCKHWYYSQASYKGDHELLGSKRVNM